MEAVRCIDCYVSDIIKAFRSYNSNQINVSVCGLTQFVDSENEYWRYTLACLNKNGFVIAFNGNSDSLDAISVSAEDTKTGATWVFEYAIQNTSSLITLSSKVGLSLANVILLKIIALLISRIKPLYKAVVLDLDDTLWPGTLSEVGREQIANNLGSDSAAPFVSFMKTIEGLAVNLGLYVAICSKNNIEDVRAAIDGLDESTFPIKQQIDCIIANHNDKSQNLKLIAEKLAILPKSMVFIDDNPLVRDEVRDTLQGMCVPEWSSHEDLMTLLEVTCWFEQHELSVSARHRKRRLKIIEAARLDNRLPELSISIYHDTNHEEAIRLYRKTNQFKLVSRPLNYTNATSICFELFRANGEETLGLCSVLTYTESQDFVVVLNWAVSCRYFGIGLEEFVCRYLLKQCGNKQIYFVCECNEDNKKAQEIIEKYDETVFLHCSDCSALDSNEIIRIFATNAGQTTPENAQCQYHVYRIKNDASARALLASGTKLKNLS